MALTADQAERLAVKFQQQIAEEKAKSSADIGLLQIELEDTQRELGETNIKVRELEQEIATLKEATDVVEAEDAG